MAKKKKQPSEYVQARLTQRTVDEVDKLAALLVKVYERDGAGVDAHILRTCSFDTRLYILLLEAGANIERPVKRK